MAIKYVLYYEVPTEMGVHHSKKTPIEGLWKRNWGAHLPPWVGLCPNIFPYIRPRVWVPVLCSPQTRPLPCPVRSAATHPSSQRLRNPAERCGRHGPGPTDTTTHASTESTNVTAACPVTIRGKTSPLFFSSSLGPHYQPPSSGITLWQYMRLGRGGPSSLPRICTFYKQ